MDANIVHIFTDGACSGNPGPGGWASILLYNGHMKEVTGNEAYTTNQRMEIRAVLGGLQALKHYDYPIIVYSDSAYVVNCFTKKWYVGWMDRDWKKANGEEVANQDLWEPLIELVRKHNVLFSKVRGHAGVQYNERCDQLAKQAIRKH